MNRSLGAAAALALLAAGPAAADKVFVSNEKSNTVSVLDSETLEVTETFDVGQRPRGIILADEGRHLLVAVGDDDTVEVYDTDTHERLHTLPSGPDPELFVLHPSGNPLYIANEDDNLVTVVDLETRQPITEIPVGVEPEGMGVSPDGSVIVNTSETTNMAHFIDAESHEIVANVLVDQRPRFAEFKSDGSEVWVSSEIGGTVSVIDPEATRSSTRSSSRFPASGPSRSSPWACASPRTARRPSSRSGPPTAWRWWTPRPTRWRSICLWASASGSSASRPTRACCSRRTASPTTSR